MSDPQVPFSLGYDHLIRDVTEELHLIRQSMPAFISLVSTMGRATQHVHEYTEDKLEPEQTLLTAGINTSATTVPVQSKLPFEVNAICRFEDHDEQVRVTSISESQNEITVQRGWGGTTQEEIDNGTKIIVVTKPKRESSRASHKGDPTAPTVNHNYTEIFDAEAVVTRSKGPVYGISTPDQNVLEATMNYKIRRELNKLARRLNNALIYGRRVKKTEGIPGTMGGMLEFHEGGNSIDADGEWVTRKILGDAMQKCFDGGAERLDTLLCNAEQARNISAIYDTKLIVERRDRELGSVIYRVQPDMPIEGFITEIVVDPNFPRRDISLFARERVRLVPFRDFTDENSRAPGDDFLARRIIGEFTAEFHNWKDATCRIRKLNPEVRDPSKPIEEPNGDPE